MTLIKTFKAPGLTLLLLAVLTSACGPESKSAPVSAGSERQSAVNVFDDYLDGSEASADGFDLPIGNPESNTREGWEIVARFTEDGGDGVNPGEDWKFSGSAENSSALNVCATANGKVVFAGGAGERFGNAVIIEHVYYENNEKRKIRSVYARLDLIKVKGGEEVRKSEPIATIKQNPGGPFHFEFRWDASLAPAYWPPTEGNGQSRVRQRYADPSAFINAHRKLFAPQREPALIIVDQSSYKMRLYHHGKMAGEYDISFGQGKGQKRVQGDNKTPKGMYFGTYKHRGKFDGAYGGYYGGHWIKINYPNRFDAVWGRSQGFITPQQESAISAKWEQRQATLENTRLGGGIGFHGWIREWTNEGPRHLSWGCVVMHIYDIGKLYDRIPERTMVVIF